MKGSPYTNFISETNFAAVLTECSSLLQGESEVSLKTPAILPIHVLTCIEHLVEMSAKFPSKIKYTKSLSLFPFTGIGHFTAQRNKTKAHTLY